MKVLSRNRIITTLMVMWPLFASWAYTVEWVVPPTDCYTMQFYKPGIFEFSTGNAPSDTCGLFSPQGERLCCFPGNAQRAPLGDNISLFTKYDYGDSGPQTLGWYLEREHKQVNIPEGYISTRIYFTEGTISVTRVADNLSGFIDINGNIVVECQFQEVMPFRDGLALVKDTNGNWMYIHKDWDKTHKPLKCGKIIGRK